MRRLQTGDQVVVISGTQKGKRGKVVRVVADRANPNQDRVVIEGVNLVKRHLKATPQRPGGILEVEAPLHSCKVMPIDPETGKPTRVKYQVEAGKTKRLAKSGAALAVSEK
jgi:large subunit ribosomal protein L24